MRLFVKVFAVCALVAGVAAPAMAQDAPKVEVSAGYNFLRVEEENTPAGWYAEVSGSVTPAVAVVGQITGNYKTLTEEEFGVDVDVKLHTFMGGVRVNGRTAAGLVPFAHVLFGAARGSASSDLTDTLDIDIPSETDAALQLGGGVKYMPANIGVQVGADYLRIFTEDEGTNAFRFAAGVVFGF
jgi:hypothetical protein